MCAKKENICMATLLQISYMYNKQAKKISQKNPQALDFNP